MIVIDATVAIKWYIKEEGTDEADNLLTGEQELVAPELIRTEVIAVIRKQIWHSVPKQSIDLLCGRWTRDLQEMSVRLFENGPLMQPAWNMATALQHSVYDCIYLALALNLGVSLVTADAAFVNKAKPRFPRVQLLPGMETD